MAQNLPEGAQSVFKGTIFTVWQWQQRLFDGSSATFECVSRPNTASVVGVMADRSILLVEDEQPNRGVVLTAPGGQIEESETPEEAGKRELLEETGYQVETLVPWFTSAPGSRVVWQHFVFIGRGLTKLREPQTDKLERIQLRLFTFDEFLALGHSGALRDMALRLHLLEALLDSKKRAVLEKLLYD